MSRPASRLGRAHGAAVKTAAAARRPSKQTRAVATPGLPGCRLASTSPNRPHGCKSALARRLDDAGSSSAMGHCERTIGSHLYRRTHSCIAATTSATAEVPGAHPHRMPPCCAQRMHTRDLWRLQEYRTCMRGTCNRCSDGWPPPRGTTRHTRPQKRRARGRRSTPRPRGALSGRGALVQPEGLAGADSPAENDGKPFVWRGCSQQILFLMDVCMQGERTGEGRSLSSHHFSPSYYSYRISSKPFPRM